jgi:hypothetical protein
MSNFDRRHLRQWASFEIQGRIAGTRYVPTADNTNANIDTDICMYVHMYSLQCSEYFDIEMLSCSSLKLDH